MVRHFPVFYTLRICWGGDEMNNDRKNIFIFLIIIFIIIFIALYAYFSYIEKAEKAEFNSRINEYNARIENKKAEEEAQEEKRTRLLEETPGIACWGDGYTYGSYGNGDSYPYELQTLLNVEDYPYTVANMGVYGEDSLTVLGRTGAIPFTVKEGFKIEGTGEDLIPFNITSENGEEVNPCIQDYNPGFNPCIVAGVDCTIYGAVANTDTTRAEIYYLSRQDGKNNIIDVPAGTKILTSGSVNYKNYINVLQVGDGGGYSDDDELLEQQIRFAESFGESEKYLIIGRLMGSDEDNEYLDEVMEEEFGDHYVNVRKLLTRTEIEGVSYSESDRTDMKKGIIPQCLKNENYLNSDGYKAVGKIVYEKIKSLNLISK